jgi:hypothetical protein
MIAEAWNIPKALVLPFKCRSRMAFRKMLRSGSVVLKRPQRASKLALKGLEEKRGDAGLHRSKHWFDVDDGRAIDDFDGADAEPVLGELPHGDVMKA